MGIITKMVLVFLATNILLVGAMAVAMRLNFQKGFNDYLTETEMARLDNTVADLSNAYRREGSWEFVRRNHRLWSRFLPSDNAHIAGESGSPVDSLRPLYPPAPARLGAQLPSGSARERPLRRLPPPPDDQTGLSARLRLLDAGKNYLIGPPDVRGNAALRAIELDDEIVGWLSLTPITVPTSSLDRSFRDEQLSAVYPIAIGALLLSLLIGIPLGRYLLRPVKALATGAHSLTQGDFKTRLDIQRRDELGQLAEDFNVLAKTLQQNELLRRQGMADVSHELRTPLALLQGEIEAMQDGIRPVDQNQLSKLHNSNTQLSRLVDDLYDLALTDAGALNYRKESLDLAEVIQQSAEAADYRLSQAGLTLQHRIPSLPGVSGDARRLRQVFDNLLKNSRRYTDAGGEVRISAWRDDSWVCIRIEDSAPAVAEENLPHLFDRFYRAEGSRNRAFGGAGLGLAICRNIVDAHQGQISARESTLGGLQVDIRLPGTDSAR
ncbi:ATP-binding protein [Marinobacterium jannaschii]|uniref:ATP-binding protein n=1 Tax=Marinobacterium jannaschii TaxID=64970 RepID=UPI000688805B|nr:ATP-binding protein [Marinobacterium jannaschii]